MKGAKYKIFDDLLFESKVVETKQGKVEYFLTEEENKETPIVICSHGGIGGVDQSRLMLDKKFYSCILITSKFFEIRIE